MSAHLKEALSLLNTVRDNKQLPHIYGPLYEKLALILEKYAQEENPFNLESTDFGIELLYCCVHDLLKTYPREELKQAHYDIIRALRAHKMTLLKQREGTEDRTEAFFDQELQNNEAEFYALLNRNMRPYYTAAKFTWPLLQYEKQLALSTHKIFDDAREHSALLHYVMLHRMALNDALSTTNEVIQKYNQNDPSQRPQIDNLKGLLDRYQQAFVGFIENTNHATQDIKAPLHTQKMNDADEFTYQNLGITFDEDIVNLRRSGERLEKLLRSYPIDQKKQLQANDTPDLIPITSTKQPDPVIDPVKNKISAGNGSANANEEERTVDPDTTTPVLRFAKNDSPIEITLQLLGIHLKDTPLVAILKQYFDNKSTQYNKASLLKICDALISSTNYQHANHPYYAQQIIPLLKSLQYELFLMKPAEDDATLKNISESDLEQICKQLISPEEYNLYCRARLSTDPIGNYRLFLMNLLLDQHPDHRVDQLRFNYPGTYELYKRLGDLELSLHQDVKRHPELTQDQGTHKKYRIKKEAYAHDLIRFYATYIVYQVRRTVPLPATGEIPWNKEEYTRAIAHIAHHPDYPCISGQSKHMAAKTIATAAVLGLIAAMAVAALIYIACAYSPAIASALSEFATSVAKGLDSAGVGLAHNAVSSAITLATTTALTGAMIGAVGGAAVLRFSSPDHLRIKPDQYAGIMEAVDHLNAVDHLIEVDHLYQAQLATNKKSVPMA